MSTTSTLIDNIFFNLISPLSTISGNVRSTVSDYLPQVFFVAELFTNSPSSKTNILLYIYIYFTG